MISKGKAAEATAKHREDTEFFHQNIDNVIEIARPSLKKMSEGEQAVQQLEMYQTKIETACKANPGKCDRFFKDSADKKEAYYRIQVMENGQKKDEARSIFKQYVGSAYTAQDNDGDFFGNEGLHAEDTKEVLKACLKPENDCIIEGNNIDLEIGEDGTRTVKIGESALTNEEQINDFILDVGPSTHVSWIDSPNPKIEDQFATMIDALSINAKEPEADRALAEADRALAKETRTLDVPRLEEFEKDDESTLKEIGIDLDEKIVASARRDITLTCLKDSLCSRTARFNLPDDTLQKEQRSLLSENTKGIEGTALLDEKTVSLEEIDPSDITNLENIKITKVPYGKRSEKLTAFLKGRKELFEESQPFDAKLGLDMETTFPDNQTSEFMSEEELRVAESNRVAAAGVLIGTALGATAGMVGVNSPGGSAALAGATIGAGALGGVGYIVDRATSPSVNMTELQQFDRYDPVQFAKQDVRDEFLRITQNSPIFVPEEVKDPNLTLKQWIGRYWETQQAVTETVITDSTLSFSDLLFGRLARAYPVLRDGETTWVVDESIRKEANKIANRFLKGKEGDTSNIRNIRISTDPNVPGGGKRQKD